MGTWKRSPLIKLYMSGSKSFEGRILDGMVGAICRYTTLNQVNRILITESH